MKYTKWHLHYRIIAALSGIVCIYMLIVYIAGRDSPSPSQIVLSAIEESVGSSRPSPSVPIIAVEKQPPPELQWKDAVKLKFEGLEFYSSPVSRLRISGRSTEEEHDAELRVTIVTLTETVSKVFRGDAAPAGERLERDEHQILVDVNSHRWRVDGPVSSIMVEWITSVPWHYVLSFRIDAEAFEFIVQVSNQNSYFHESVLRGGGYSQTVEAVVEALETTTSRGAARASAMRAAEKLAALTSEELFLRTLEFDSGRFTERTNLDQIAEEAMLAFARTPAWGAWPREVFYLAGDRGSLYYWYGASDIFILAFCVHGACVWEGRLRLLPDRKNDDIVDILYRLCPGLLIEGRGM